MRQISDRCAPHSDRLAPHLRPVGSAIRSYWGNGAADNHVKIGVRMIWDDVNNTASGQQDFIYGEDMIRTVYHDNKTFDLTVTGIGDVEKFQNFKYYSIVIADNGVEYAGEQISFNGTAQ